MKNQKKTTTTTKMASGQTPNKISPRKFSEKIALLNKKEAEGNAEFEEIIKEVQATRTHSANESASKCAKRSNNNNNNNNRTGAIVSNSGGNRKSVEQWRSEERLELEEVFQSLIQSVGTYQDDDEQQRQQHQQEAGESICTAGTTIQSRSLSAGPPTSRDNTFHGIPQNSMTTFGSNETFSSFNNANSLQSNNMIAGGGGDGQTQDRISSNDLNSSSSNIPNQQYPFQREQQQQQQQISTTSQSDIHLIAGTTDGNLGLEQIQNHNVSSTPIAQTACRARFSSIGSAMYRNLCANNTINTNNNNQNDSLNCLVPTMNNGQQMYLRPNINQQQSGCLAAASDKNWPQKSCSDPTLNMLAQVNQQQQQQNNYSDTNSNMDTRMICDQDSARNNTVTGSYHDHHQQEPTDYQISDNSTSCFEHQMSSSQKLSPIACYENIVQGAADVPGINICTIEDDSSSLFRPPDPNQQQQRQHQDSSLPDLSNLQFASPEDVVNYVPDLQQQQQQSIHQIQDTAYCDQNQTITNSDNNFVQLDNSNYDRVSYKGGGAQNVSQTILTNNNGNDYWTNARAAESLYAPKVNNTLSVSECGLTTCSRVPGADLIQSNIGIMRSHSHNSIDNMTRRTTVTAFNKQHNNTPTDINCIQTDQLQNQPNQNLPAGFGHNHLQQQQLTFGQQQQQQQQVNNFTNQRYQDQFLGLQNNDCSFVGSNNSSIDPQHGSVSPLNSSLSNLTSPQSEQNSPGSSNNDYLDYLPYPVSATANHLQAQNNMTTAGFQSSQQHYTMDNDTSITLRDKTTTATNEQIEICNRQGEEIGAGAGGTDVIMLHQPDNQNGACILTGSTGLLPATGGQNCILYQQQQQQHRLDNNNNNNNSYQVQYTLSDQELNNRKQFQHSSSAFTMNQHSNVNIITHHHHQQQQQQQQLSNCRAYSNSSKSLRSSPSEQNR